MDNTFSERFEWRQIVGRDFHKNLRIDPMIGMAKFVAEIHHASPIDCLLLRLNIVWQSTRSFANHFKRTLDGKSQRNIAGQFLKSFRCEQCLNHIDCCEDVH